jgi:hypothetical protein
VARRTIRVIDIVELYQHWHAGRRIGELSSSLGVDPKTIRKYTAPALAAGIVPGGPPLSAQEWSTLAEGWFPGAADRSRRQSSWADIEPHRKRIEGWLGEVTVSTIHQRLRDDHGLSASQSSLRRYLLANFAEEVARSAVTVLRETPPAGEEGLCGIPHKPSYGAPGTMRRGADLVVIRAGRSPDEADPRCIIPRPTSAHKLSPSMIERRRQCHWNGKVRWLRGPPGSLRR